MFLCEVFKSINRVITNLINALTETRAANISNSVSSILLVFFVNKSHGAGFVFAGSSVDKKPSTLTLLITLRVIVTSRRQIVSQFVLANLDVCGFLIVQEKTACEHNPPPHTMYVIIITRVDSYDNIRSVSSPVAGTNQKQNTPGGGRSVSKSCERPYL